LYNARNRDLSPTLGHLIQFDPSGFAAGTIFYKGLANAPTGLVDSNGLVAMGPNGEITPGPFSAFSAAWERAAETELCVSRVAVKQAFLTGVNGPGPLDTGLRDAK
jgi:hypothetical protein